MRKIGARALLLTGALFLVLYLCKYYYTGHVTNQPQVYEDTNPIQNITPTNRNAIVPTWPVCHKNASAADLANFTSLPARFQDFLYRRHCRHLPMLLDVPDKCGGADKSANVFLLLVIKSSPQNYERREILRKTWAEERLHNGVWIRRVFISGTAGAGFEKRRLSKLLELEHREHNDILQWDLQESHFNLTLKQILFLEWMERNCPQARFLLNGDDDVLANTDNMVEYFQNLKDNNGSRHIFVGHLIVNDRPVRDKSSKYYIPVELQEEESYPPFCGGGGLLMSGYTAMVIYKMSKTIPIFPLDDIYIAMCLAKAGLLPESHMGVRNLGLDIPSDKLDNYDPCFYKDLLVVHRFLPPQLYVMWHGIHDPNRKC